MPAQAGQQAPAREDNKEPTLFYRKKYDGFPARLRERANCGKSKATTGSEQSVSVHFSSLGPTFGTYQFKRIYGTCRLTRLCRVLL
jgi:hypothetical protein